VASKLAMTARGIEPLRITLVTHYFPAHRGGVEAVAWEIASRLAGSGVARITWHASDTDPPPPDVPGLRYVPAAACNAAERFLGFPYPLWSPGALARLARSVGSSDVVHVHDCLYLGNIVAALAARRAGRPVVVTQHVGRIPYRNPVLRSLAAAATYVLGKLVLARAAQCVFVSEVVLREFERFVAFRRAPLRVANGVDTRVFRPVPEQERRALRIELAGSAERPLLLFAGRFVEKKGLHLLRRLAEALPHARWLFAGWGPLDPERWNLPQVGVQRHVAHEALARLYQAADVLVLPSVGEGFPLVVQEAMACGTPALVSDETAAGCPEAAWLLLREPLGDEGAAERWRSRIASLLDSPEELHSLRPRVAEFARAAWSWDSAARRYAEVLQNAARSP
jgi:glycosyltransferase involved in cell wall biosynthesis